MSWYRDGTVSVANGSSTVTGTGTLFLTQAKPGQIFIGPDDQMYEISSLTDDTTMVLATNYLGVTASAQSYAIVRIGEIISSGDVLTDISNLVSRHKVILDEQVAWHNDLGLVTVTNPIDNTTSDVKTWKQIEADMAALAADYVTTDAVSTVTAMTTWDQGGIELKGVNSDHMLTFDVTDGSNTNVITFENNNVSSGTMIFKPGTDSLDISGLTLRNDNNIVYHEGNLTTAVINALNVNATTVDNLDSSQFVRSDTSDVVVGNHEFYGTDIAGGYGTAPVEIREVNLVLGSESTVAYAPAITWHWGGVTQGQLALHNNGEFFFREGTGHATTKTVNAGRFNADIFGNDSNIKIRPDGATTDTYTFTSTELTTGTGVKIITGGDVIVGNTENRNLSVRHLNGKAVDSTAGDHLYLQHSNGFNVYIGGEIALHRGALLDYNYAPADLDLLTTPGFHFAATATLNKPANGVVIHGKYQSSSNLYDSQILVSHATDSMYFRSKDNGTWESWKQVAVAGEANQVLGSPVKISGTNAGTSNSSWLGFYEANGTTRQAYIGLGSTGSNEVQIFAESGAVGLFDNGTRKFTTNSTGAHVYGEISADDGFVGTVWDKSGSIGGRVWNPKGGDYTTGTNLVTGAIKIRLPVYNVADMISFTVNVFDYSLNESFKVHVSGYVYQDTGNNEWVNTTATIIGVNGTTRDFTVRFGADGSKHCVWIGETTSTWNYPQVFVSDVFTGYTSTVSDYIDGWDITFETAFDTVDDTHTDCMVRAGWAKDAGSVDGLDSTAFARLGTTSPPSDYLYTTRSSVSSALYVRQGSTGPIARFFQSSTAAGTDNVNAKLEITNTGNIDIRNTSPIITLRDNDATGASQTGYISLKDDGGTERAWMGYGTSANADLGIQNTQGDVWIGSGGSEKFRTTANGATVTGSFTATSNIYYESVIQEISGSNDRDKIRVWSGAPYGIGMDTGYTFGGLNNDYAMTFQMNNNVDRGFWWGVDTDTNAQGAMALTTDGKLTVATAMRVGYGKTDAVAPQVNGHEFDVLGESRFDGDVTIGGSIADNHWLTLYGADGSTERTGISIGESGKWGSASLHIYYTGDGYSHIGMGTMSASTHAADRCMTMHYQNQYVDFHGNIRPAVTGVGQVGTSARTFQSMYSQNYYINDSNTRINEGGSNSARVTTNSGYVEIGPKNTSYCHFDTDRSTFYFGQGMEVNGDVNIYNTSYGLASTGQLTASGISCSHIYNPGYARFRLGTNGAYGNEGSSGTGWGATIWGIGDSYDGTSSGLSYSKTSVYGVSWLRSAHTNSSTHIGEGIYVYTNGSLEGGIGTAGIYSGAAIRSVGDATWNASDIRLKKNWKPLQSASDSIRKIKVGHYDWDEEACEKAGHNPGRESDLGFNAQTLQEAGEELVSKITFEDGDGEEYLTPRDRQVLAMTVKALQEALQRIETLEETW